MHPAFKVKHAYLKIGKSLVTAILFVKKLKVVDEKQNEVQFEIFLQSYF